MIDGYLVQTPNLIFFCDVKRYLFVLEKGEGDCQNVSETFGVFQDTDEIVGLVNRVYNRDMETFISSQIDLQLCPTCSQLINICQP